MKRKTINRLLALCMTVGTGAFIFACGQAKDTLPEITGEKRETQAEFGETIDLTAYFGATDTIVNAMLYSPSGERLSMKDGSAFFNELGTYTLYLQGGNGVVFTVADTKGPHITRTTIQDYYYLEQEFDLGLRAIDNYSLSYSQTEDGEKEDITAQVKNYAFTPTKEGYYTVSCSAKDSLGNASQFSYTFYAETYYELLYDNNMSLTGEAVSLGYQFKEVDGEKKRLVSHTVSGASWATLDFICDSLNGETFHPFTTYEFSVDYTVSEKAEETVASPFTLYLSNACYTVFHKADGDTGTLTFQVTSNKNGDLYWHYANAMRFNYATHSCPFL